MGHPEIAQAATDALERWGTGASASRLVSGERPPHRALEQVLASLYGTEDAMVYVSGHATNVSTIGKLFGPNDVIFTIRSLTIRLCWVHSQAAHAAFPTRTTTAKPCAVFC